MKKIKIKIKINNEFEYHIKGTCQISELKMDYLAYIEKNKYLDYVKGDEKGYILIPMDIDIQNDSNTWIQCDNPKFEFLKIHNAIYPLLLIESNIHPTVIWNKDTVILGKNVSIQPYSVIGFEGFRVMADSQGNLHKLRHAGGVKIGDNVDIGTGTYIARGTFKDTLIGDNTKIDNSVHIGHNVKIGKNCIICAGVIVGGSTTIGDNVFIGLNTVIRNNLKIGNSSFIGMGLSVIQDVKEGERVTKLTKHR